MGARWCVGAGKSIDILNQPWLLDNQNPYITKELQVLGENKVDSLMNIESKTWDEDLVKDLFNERDQACILNVQLSPSRDDDRLYWKEELSGCYSVRSAYRLLQVQKGMWNSSVDTDLWPKLWSIKVPSKVAHVCWCALSGCLPTMTQLVERHVPVQRTCPVCNLGDETVYHAFVSCSFATQCWQKVLRDIHIETSENFQEWFSHILNAYSKEKWGEVAMVCWAIWKARNELVWQQKRSQVDNVISSTKNYFVQWKNAQSLVNIALFPSDNDRDRDGAIRWVRPQLNTIKVSVDAAMFVENAAFGIGIIARNSEGELVHAQTVRRWGMVSPEMAEAMAIKEALGWTKSQPGQAFEVESDCLAVIQAIKSRVAMVSQVGVVIEECRALLLCQSNVQLLFVKRSANMGAHSLARASYSFPDRLNNCSMGVMLLLKLKFVF